MLYETKVCGCFQIGAVFLSCYFCYLKYKKKNVQVLFMVYSHFGNITEYPLFKKRA